MDWFFKRRFKRSSEKRFVQASAICLKLILPNLPAVGRILESDTLYYFLFHVGYKYPTYNLNGFLFQTTSNAAFFLDHQNPRFAARMGDVFRADSCVEDVAAFQPNDVFFAVFSVVHIDFAVHYGKHFLAVVDVPFVGLWSVQCRRTVVPFILAMSSAPHAREAVNSAERMVCVSGIFASL